VFSDEQRAILKAAWDKGFLCDPTNYGSLSRVTGLNRKQISNWARAQIRNAGNNPLPVKTDAPLGSIFKSLPDRELLGIALHPFSTVPQTNNIGSDQKLLPPLQWSSPQINQIYYPLQTKNLPSADFSSLTAMPFVEPEIHITPAKQWILTNALSGSDEITEHMIGILSLLTCIPHRAITTYILQNGWRTKATVLGMRYYREQTTRISDSTDSPWQTIRREQWRGV